MACPNTSHPQWKKLVKHLGPVSAMTAFNRNGEQIPDYTKAPNGEDSILFNEMKEQFGEQQAYEVKFKVESPQFKEWFEDSEIVDENEEPRIMYHGSHEKFNRFNEVSENIRSLYLELFESKGEKRTQIINKLQERGERIDTIQQFEMAPNQGARFLFQKGSPKEGIFFTEHKELAERYGGIIYPVFLKASNIKDITEYDIVGISGVHSSRTEEAFKENESLDAITGIEHGSETLTPEGYYSVAVRNNDQIKSVFNEGTFSEGTTNIYKQKTSSGDIKTNDFQQQKNILSRNLKTPVILDTEMEEAGQVRPGEDGRPVVAVNPNQLGGDTLIHEYGHIFIDILGGMNNSMISQGRKYLEGSPLEAEVTQAYPELSGEILDKEILTTAIGREGKDIFDARKSNLIRRFEKWVELFFNRLKKAIGLEFNVAQELARQMLSDQVLAESNENIRIEEVQAQKSESQVRKAKVLDDRKKLLRKIIDSLNSKIVRFNNVLRDKKSTPSRKREALEELQSLVNKLNQAEDWEGMIDFVQTAAEETAQIKTRLDMMDENVETEKEIAVTSEHLNLINQYSKTYQYTEEIRDLLAEDRDLYGIFDETIVNQSAKKNMLDLLDQVIKDYRGIRKRYNTMAKVHWATKMAQRDGKIHNKYREQYRQEFQKNHRRKNPLIGKQQYYLKGKQVSRGEYEEARRQYVNGKIADNKNQIVEEERQYLMSLMEIAPQDLSKTYTQLMDPDELNDDLIQIAYEELEFSEYNTMRESVRKFKDADDLFQRFEKVKPQGDQREKYDEMIEDQVEVDENGNVVKTGKKNNYMVGRYYGAFYDMYSDIKMRTRIAKEANLSEDKIWDDQKVEDSRFSDGQVNAIRAGNVASINESDKSMKINYADRTFKVSFQEYQGISGNSIDVVRTDLELSEFFDSHTRKVAGKILPTAQWKNPQFDELQKLREEESVIAEMYDFLMDDLRDDTENKYANIASLEMNFGEARFHMLPSVNRTNMERTVDEGFLTTVKEGFQDITKVRAEDTSYRPEQVEEDDSMSQILGKQIQRTTKVLADEHDQLRQTVPIHLRNEQKLEDQSFDLLSIHLLDNSLATNYDNKVAIQPDIEILKEIMAERKVVRTENSFLKGTRKLINKATGQETDPSSVKIEGIESNSYEALTSLIESRLYGIQKLGNTMLNKISDQIRQYTGDVYLIGNYFSGGANLLQGKSQNFIESLGSEYFNVKDLAVGEKKYWDDMPSMMTDAGKRRYYSKTNLLMELFNSLGDWKAVSKRFAEDNRFKQLFKKSSLHFMINGPEHYIQNTLMYAILNRIKVKNANGEFLTRDDNGDITTTENADEAMSLDEAYSVENGRLVLADEVHHTTHSIDPSKEIDQRDHGDIYRLIRNINADLQGQFDSRQVSVLQRTWYGRMFDTLRRWIFRGTSRRMRGLNSVKLAKDQMEFHESFYSRSRRRDKSGMYTDGLRFLLSGELLTTFREEGIRKIFELKKEQWNNLSNRELNNIRKSIGELGMAMLMFSTAALVKGLAESEDDEQTKKWLYTTAFYQRRLYSELIFYMNPMETIRIMRSPAASLNLLEDTIQLGDQLASDVFGNGLEFERYQRGRREGMTKIEKDIRDLVPIWKQFDRNIEEALGWLYMDSPLQ